MQFNKDRGIMGFAMDYSSVGKDFSILNRLCGNKLIDKQIFSVYRNRSLTEQNNNQTANCSYRYSGLDKLFLGCGMSDIGYGKTQLNRLARNHFQCT